MKSRSKIFIVCLLVGPLFGLRAYGKSSHKEKPAAEEAAPAPEEVSDEASSATDRADEYVTSGHYEQAVLLLKPLVDSLPRKGLILLAKAYAGQKDYQSQIRTLELCRAKSPRDYIVLTLLGDAYRGTSRSDDAVAIYQEAREMNGKYRPAFEGILKVLEKTDDHYEARELVADMIKVFGASPSLDSTLCRLYSLDGFIEKSVETCKAAIKSDSSNPENHIFLAASLKDQEDGNKASTILKAAADRFPASEHVQSAAGSLASEKKDYISAYQFYKKASADDPQSVRALLGLANSSFKLQKNEESLAAFSKACTLNRHDATREFSGAISELRSRKDINWQAKFQNVMSTCGQ